MMIVIKIVWAGMPGGFSGDFTSILGKLFSLFKVVPLPQLQNPILQQAMSQMALFEPLAIPLAERIYPNLVPRCDRDYSSCPYGFQMVGKIYGGDQKYCAADVLLYGGKCAREVVSFTGWANEARDRWAEFCGVYWPCIQCERNYATPCPKFFKLNKEHGTCEPKKDYEGPCNEPQNFNGLGPKGKALWEVSCGAFWPCKK